MRKRYCISEPTILRGEDKSGRFPEATRVPELQKDVNTHTKRQRKSSSSKTEKGCTTHSLLFDTEVGPIKLSSGFTLTPISSTGLDLQPCELRRPLIPAQRSSEVGFAKKEKMQKPIAQSVPKKDSKESWPIGNKYAWEQVEKWAKDRLQRKGAVVLILQGPTGVGKTSGIPKVTESAGWHICSQLGASDIAAPHELLTHVAEGIHRSGWRETDTGGLVCIDELEAFAEDTVKSLTSYLGSVDSTSCTGVIIIARAGLRINKSLRAISMTVTLQSLSLPELAAVARRSGFSESNVAIKEAAILANGDARQILIAMQSGLSGIQVERGCTPSNPFDAAKVLLYSHQCPINDVEVIMDTFPTPLMQSLILANYQSACTIGTSLGIDTVTDSAEAISASVLLCSGPSRPPLAEGSFLLANCTRMSGFKNGDLSKIRLDLRNGKPVKARTKSVDRFSVLATSQNVTTD